MDEKLKKTQKITQMKFHDFKYPVPIKSTNKVKISSHTEFSQKEIKQKEMILKELTKALQQKLSSYQKNENTQKLLLKEEEQKKKISQEMNQMISKNHKEGVEEFLQTISNKMNMNIVPAINTINQILESTNIDNDKKSNLEEIKTNLFEFLDDSSRITEYQRLIQGDKEIHKTIVNIETMIRKVFDQCQSIAMNKNVKFIFENHSVETIFCDESRIPFVLNSLIKNSIDLCERNSDIKISITGTEEQTSFSIISKGKGFSHEFLDEVLSNVKKIKNPFDKNNEIKTNIIISRMIIQNHQGELSIISQPEQKTEVSFTLPSRIMYTTGTR